MIESTEIMITNVLSSKKEKLRPRPEIDDEELPPSKKIKVSSTSKKVMVNEKKHEVILKEDSVEIIDTDVAEFNGDDTPSKRSFKPVSDHVKTPFSKIKENEEDAGTPINGSILKVSGVEVDQPNFSDIKSASAESKLKSTIKSSLAKIQEDDDNADEKNTSENQSDPMLDATAISEEA